MHVFDLRRDGHQLQAADRLQLIKSLWVNFENTGCAGTGVWPPLIKLSNFG